MKNEINSSINKNQELADKALCLLPETIEKMAKKLNVSGQELEDTIKNDIRFFPPGPNDKMIWRLNFKTDGQETPGTYFEGKNFISKWLGDEILQTNMLKTTSDNETIYNYRDGIWIPDGENLIKIEASRRLGQKNTSHRIAETITYIKYNTFIDREEFNKDPYLLALKNGVLNIKTNKLKPHDPKYMINVKIPLIYDPEAECPLFEKFLSEVVDESDIPLIYELFGWCLVRNYEIQKMVMFLGEGANGKSTLLNALKAFLGPENVSNISPQNLSERTFSPAQLHGKLANLYNDVPDKSLRQTGILKQLCGQDSITAEQKFKNPFSFENYAKLLFSCNKLPISRDDTDAWFRRWTFANFPNVFDEKTRDKGILKKLTTPQELSGILNNALEGIIRIEENGAFTNSESTIALREKYLRLADPVAAFCMDCVVEDVEASIPKSELYGHYVAYCKKNKLLIVSIDVFGKRIIMVIKTESERLTINERRVMCWKGIMLKNADKKPKPKEGGQTTL